VDSIKILFVTLILLLSSLLLTCGSSNKTDNITDEDFDIVVSDILLRPGVTVDIHVKVYENKSMFCHSLRKLNSDSDQELLDERTILAVHGRNLDSRDWEPLAQALFNENPTGETVCRFLALDQPGHGNSGLPVGDILFGELSYSDYVTTLLAILDNLPNYGIGPMSLIGHSAGGVVLQITQQRLADEGTDLFEIYNIRRVTLLAPAPLAPVFWQYLGIDFPTSEALLVSCFGMAATTEPCSDVDFVENDIIDWDDIYALWFDGVRFDCDWTTVPFGSPPLESVPPDCEPSPPGLGDTFDEFNTGQPEPFTILRESFGTPPQIRPSTDPGIFGLSSMPELQIVVFKNDTLIYPVPELGEEMYIYLTGDDSLQRFKVAEGADDGHIMNIVNPSGMLESIAGTIVLP